MKSDLNRFYQIVSGQMETPELVRKNKRAYASRENNHINSGEGMTKTTLWHEMGHFVEYRNPEILIAAKQLFEGAGQHQALSFALRMRGSASP